MFFTDYSEIEVSIFKKVKNYFEALPPGADDYDNGFFDVVAQYAGGGGSYMIIGGEYDRLIKSVILTEVEKLSPQDLNLLKEMYEVNFLSDYFDEYTEKYLYSDEDLSVEIFGRFKCWIDDNFNLDEMLNEIEEEDYEDDSDEITDSEDDEIKYYLDDQNSKEKIDFLRNILQNLLGKPLSNIQKRKIQIAMVYLSYHPIAPGDEYVLTISFNENFVFFEIIYAADLIKLSEYYTEDGTVFYNYQFELMLSGKMLEEGNFDDFIINVDYILKEKLPSEIGINNEYM